LVVDWEHATRRMVAQFRASHAEHVSEPAWRSLVKRLQDASPEFSARWEEHHVAAPANVVKQFRHPELGLLRFTATHLWLSQRLGKRMLVYTPADDATESTYARLAQMSPAPLTTRTAGSAV
jgi:hypothetical protein